MDKLSVFCGLTVEFLWITLGLSVEISLVFVDKFGDSVDNSLLTCGECVDFWAFSCGKVCGFGANLAISTGGETIIESR